MHNFSFFPPLTKRSGNFRIEIQSILLKAILASTD